jgi:Lrp/AsnC family transcriptional regulator for asnA, asnC and gidA
MARTDQEHLPEEFDQVDRQIIRLLQQDCRASATELAPAVGLSDQAVRVRIRRLLEADAVRPTVVVNPRAFGYHACADIQCIVDPEALTRIGDELLGWPRVTYLSYAASGDEIGIQVQFKSSDDVYPFTRRLAAIPGVRRTKTILVPDVVKSTHDWAPPPSDFSK